MSKVEKILLITFAALIPVGLILVVLGLKFGGTKGWSVNVDEMKYTDNGTMVEKTLDLDEFDKISAKIASADMTVQTGDSYQLYYKVREGREPIVNVSGKKLTIDKPKQITFFSFDFNTESDKYVLTVPAGNKEYAVDLTTSSGEINVDKVAMAGNLQMSSGDITLHDFDSTGLEIKASSGDLIMENVNPENLNITISSGAVKGSGITAKTVSATASSGDMVFEDLKAGEANFKISSGEIVVNNGTLEVVNGKMTSGDITLNLSGKRDDYDFDLSATSGEMTIDGEEFEKSYLKEAGKKNKITMKATSGDVDVNFQ
ncbi:MAG: DUF4097 family beta strand repeat protein [Lachnospiraceae bacterium]|nr:DUF4097 family beta strand repeat protein [Lachnospiraceae bacterium]